MKNKITNLASLILLSSAINASAVTTVTVGNLDTADSSDWAIVDSAQNWIGLGEGSIAVGYFNTFTSSSDFTNLSSTLTDFQQFGTDVNSFDGGAFGVVGFFESQHTATLVQDGDFIGKTLSVIIGDKSTIAGSDEFAIWRLDGSIFSNEVAGIGALGGSVKAGSATLLFGTDISTAMHPGGPLVDRVQLGTFSAVPEPSSTALLGLGSLGLLLRRRR